MYHGECITVKFSEGLGIFDHHYGYPQIDYLEIYEGPTGKVIDIQGIQAHAGHDFFVPEGKEFSINIDQCPYLHIAIKAEPGTNTCLFLLVHERKHDWNRRFVVIGKTPEGECRHHLMSNHFTIKDDNKWKEYVYDLRTIREEKDDNIYHQPICQDAGSIREIQFYSWTGGTHTFYFGPSKAPAEVRIKDLPPWLQSLFTPRSTNRRAMSSRLQFLPSKERFERLVKNFENISRLGAAQKAAAHEIIKVQEDYRRAEKKTRGIRTEFSEEEKLRILIFDGPVGLTQTLTHERLSYPLDNPSIRIPPPSGYVGYIIVADRIILKDDINTKGHDLVLVAKEISVSNDVPRVVLNTQPPEMEQAAQEQEGKDADNGGDIIFLAKEFLNSSKVRVVTMGGTGQDGGYGRLMSNPTTVAILKEETSITNALLWGKYDLVDFQPHDSFYRDPPSCWFVRYEPDTPYGTYYVLPPLPRGSYMLVNWAHDAATFTTVWINIDAIYYPTDGKSGGYGGLPGKVNLIMPKAPTMPGIAVTAETGSDGAPGNAGAGGEMMPVSVYLPTGDPAPLEIHEYINRRSKDNLKVTDRFDTPGTTSSYFPSGTDRFRNIDTKYPSRIVEALSKLEVTGGIKIRYYASIDAKQSGDESRLDERWSAGPYMKRAAFRYRCKLAYFNDMWFANLANYDYFQSTLFHWGSCEWPKLGLHISGGRDGDPLPPTPTVTEQLQIFDENWYNVVYQLVPEYPERLAKRADMAYRAGDFISALSLYQDLIAFSDNSAFESEELVSDALYRIEIGNLGLDYFGFRPDTIIPVSPSREVDLITHYSSAVKFFNEAIRDAIASNMERENFILLLEEFSRQRGDIMSEIQDSLTATQFNLSALMLDKDAMRHEIDATYRANIRMGGLLESWINYVNDRIEKLKDEAPTPKAWQTMLKAIWTYLQLIAAVIAVVYGYVGAASKAMDAGEKLTEIGSNYDELAQAVEETNETLDTITSEEAEALTERMLGTYTKLQRNTDQFFDLVKSASDELVKAMEKTRQLKEKFEELRTIGDTWTESEAIDFRNNVLLAEQIGVSGGMTYLQIQEQMLLNDDLLVAKYLALEAAQIRCMHLSERFISLTKELLRHEANRRYLLDVIDALDSENVETSSVASQLKKIGQGDLDAMMRRLQEHTFQLKFLELDTTPSPGRYDRFIESHVDVGAVLNEGLQLKEKISAWTANNANIGRLKVVVSRTSLSELGKLIFVSPLELDNFSIGEYVRISQIYGIEPLRETQLVRNIADAVNARLDYPARLLTILTEQFPDEAGIATKYIVSRERQYHTILNDPAVTLEDREVVLAYAMATGGVTPPILGEILSQSNLRDPLKSSLQKLATIWPTLSFEIISEDVKSVRQVSQTIALERANPSAVVAILDDAFIVSGSPALLNRFHINSNDVRNDIADCYDPDFQDYEVLGSIHNSDDLNIILAITLLYAGLDKSQLQAVANQYSAGHIIGDRLASMLPEWDNLRRSVLERKHTLMVDIVRDDFMTLPNTSGTYEHRFLAGRAELESLPGALELSVVLKKLPEDLYEKEASGILAIAFPVEDQIVFPDTIATPPSFVLSDYHYNALFGRSVLGGWELTLYKKGNTPSLPDIQKVELEIIYSYKK